MASSEVARVVGETAHPFPKAALFVLDKIAHSFDFSEERQEGVIGAIKRHPLAAIVAGLAIGLAALALTDRLTRRW